MRSASSCSNVRRASQWAPGQRDHNWGRPLLDPAARDPVGRALPPAGGLGGTAGPRNRGVAPHGATGFPWGRPEGAVARHQLNQVEEEDYVLLHKYTRTEDILLAGTAHLFLSEFDSATRVLRDAVPALRTGAITREQIATWFHLVLAVTNDLYDDETYNAWVEHSESTLIDGALFALQYVLAGRAKTETRSGNFQIG